MKQNNLENVIKLNEFRDYLRNGELIKLSMSCKKFRKSLSSYVFNSFCMKSFAKSMGYKSGIINKEDSEFEAIEQLYLESKAIKADEDKNDSNQEYLINNCSGVNEGENSEDWYRYSNSDSDYEYSNTYIHNPFKPLAEVYLENKVRCQSELNQLPFRPKKLKIDLYSGDYSYLIDGLYNVFSNISILSISWSTIKLEALQDILDNLSYLEDLELCGNTIVKSGSSSNSYSINWPLNLRKLEISYTNFGFISDNEDYIKSTFSGKPLIDEYDLNLSPKSLPCLHTLALVQSTHIEASDFNYDDQFLGFLKMNYHIKNLEISFRILRPEFFETVRDFNDLIKLRLTMGGYGHKDSFLAIKPPALPSLKSLDFEYEYGAYIFKIIGQQFPNLTDLTYYPEYLLQNNIEQYAYSLETLNYFKSLKNLKLKVLLSKDLSLLNLPKLYNLEVLEISQVCCDNNFELAILTSKDDYFPNLKLAKFTRFKGDDVIDKPELSNELKTHYKFLYFPYTLAFYNKNKI